MYTSIHFSIKELSCRDGTCGKMPNEEIIKIADQIRSDYGHPITCTSGARCDAYTAKLILQGTPAALKSQHIAGFAMDLAPTDMPIQHLHAWIEDKLEKYGIWIEDPKSTKSWLHIQCKPFAGWVQGKSRIFKP